MGGTTHVYTDEELQYLCGECHDAKTENREVGLRER
jgi:5-methylcytosine-specific restriction endonuclease McrA